MANGENGNAWHRDVPSWVKTFAFLVGTVGFPIFVASYFMAMNAGLINSPMVRNEQGIVELQRGLTAAITEMKGVVAVRNKNDEKQLQIAGEMCRAISKLAKDQEQERMCDYWRRP
jgi:hypothetical protein